MSYEENFDGRYSIGGNVSISGVKCKKCGKILYYLMAVEGQTQLKSLLEFNGLEFLAECNIICPTIEEIQDGEYTLLKATGLLKCPECFHVNEIHGEYAKNCKENMYKNFD